MIKELPEIPKGQHGWKINKLQRAILDRMKVCTTPKCGWSMYQKLKHNFRSYSGQDFCIQMFRLKEWGYLEIACHYDGEPCYVLSDK